MKVNTTVVILNSDSP